MEITHAPGQLDHLSTFRRLFLAHDPPHQAWMQPPGAAAKYRKKFHPISDAELAAHLAGRLTIAAPLTGTDDLAYAAALDIDHGGDDALCALLDAAHGRALTGFALTSTYARHNGGHVWLLFDAPAVPTRLRRLADELAHAVAVAAETYPSGRMLRLPLGVHRGSGQRGRLLLQDGTVLDLDADADAIATALAAARRPAAQRGGGRCRANLSVASPDAAQTRQDGSGATNEARSTIEAYNAATDLLGLLDRLWRAHRRAVSRRPGGTALPVWPAPQRRCPCQPRNPAGAQSALRPVRRRRLRAQLCVLARAARGGRCVRGVLPL